MKRMYRITSILLISVLLITLFPSLSFAGSDETTIIVPHGAVLEVNLKPQDSTTKKPLHYVPFSSVEPISVTKGESQDRYVYQINSERIEDCHYRVSQTGYVAKAGLMSKKDIGGTIPVSLTELTGARIDYTADTNTGNDFFEDGLLMNIGSSSCLKMEPNESFQIRTYRTWQIVNDVSSNYIIEPDWHFEVIRGNSAQVSDTGLVTAVDTGMSMIRVTYEPINVGGIYYNGTDPIHTGIIIVNVQEDKRASVATGIYTTEFDTVYYGDMLNGEPTGETHAEYSFTPEEGTTVSVLEAPKPSEAISGDWTEIWTDYTAGSHGAYTVNLYPGRNVVRLEKEDGATEYHVIRAAGLGINIKNRTNPGEALAQGSTARITFDGLFMPLPKLAAVYNPGYVSKGEGTVRVEYSLDGATIKGKGTQYQLRSNNQLDIPLDQIGSYHLTEGEIRLTYYGSKITHYTIPDSGVTPNFGAGEKGPFYYCKLPDITFEAADAEVLTERAKLDYAKLDSVSLLAPNEIDPNASSSEKLIINNGGILLDDKDYYYNNIVSWSTKSNPSRLMTIKEAVAVNDDKVKKLWRYWEGTSPAAVQELPAAEKQGPYTSLTTDFANGELIIVPVDEEYGYPRSYSFKGVLFSKNASATAAYRYNLPYLSDLDLIPLNGKEDFKATDGLLQAKDTTYVDAQGKEKTLDFGYGFLTTEAEHEVNVPYATDKIQLSFRFVCNLAPSTATAEPKGLNATGVTVSAIVGEEEIYNHRYVLNDTTPTITPQITLQEGTTQVKLNITSSNYNNLSMTYVVNVVRSGAPRTVTFSPETFGTELVVKNSKNQIAEPGADGTYSLSAGDYTYIITKSGYLSRKAAFTVGAEDKTISIPALEPTPSVSEGDRVTVLVRGDTGTVRSSISVSMTDDPDKLDLVTGKKYVDYNAGAYTALHAVIDALETGLESVGYSCYKGYLRPGVEIDEKNYGTNCGWVCEVNGAYVSEPAYYVLKSGDSVVYYYNRDYDGMVHAWFEKEMFSVAKSGAITVSLAGIKAKDPSVKAGPLSGAAILVNNEETGITDSSGQCQLTFNEPGTYAVTARQTDSSGRNLLTYNYCIVQVSGTSEEVTPGKTTVRFRLIGDALHGDEEHGTYVNWIKTKKYTFSGDSVTVYDVFTTVLDDAGLGYKGADKNYITKIKAPKAYGEYWLSEFDNGPNSGWMYMVNGKHSKLGLKEYSLTTGDVIIWHYVDNYKEEEENYAFPADVDPPDDGSIIDMSKGNSDKSKSKASVTIDLTAKTDSTGKATVKVSAKELSSALTEVLKMLSTLNAADESGKENRTAEIKLEIKANGSASAVETSLPVESFKAIAKEDKTVLTLATSVGTLAFDHQAIAALSQQAGGSDLKITVGKADSSELSVKQRQTVADRMVFKLDLISGNQSIMDFKGGKVTVSLPYLLGQGETSEKLCVYYLNDSSELTQIQDAKYSEKTGLVTFTTDHFSYYVIGMKPTNPFGDIKETDWFYENVMDLVGKGIVKGKTETAYAPGARITRAEFAQILYGMAKAEAGVSGSAITAESVKVDGAKAETAFTDVKKSHWFSKSVEWAYSAGVVSGIKGPGGTLRFEPNAEISRQDMAVMLKNYADKAEEKELPKTTSAEHFEDELQIKAYAKEAVALMQQGGIINGVKRNQSDGASVTVFQPASPATRAEAATIISKLLKVI